MITDMHIEKERKKQTKDRDTEGCREPATKIQKSKYKVEPQKPPPPQQRSQKRERPSGHTSYCLSELNRAILCLGPTLNKRL